MAQGSSARVRCWVRSSVSLIEVCRRVSDLNGPSHYVSLRHPSVESLLRNLFTLGHQFATSIMRFRSMSEYRLMYVCGFQCT